VEVYGNSADTRSIADSGGSVAFPLMQGLQLMGDGSKAILLMLDL
jgi:hypothetical protein